MGPDGCRETWGTGIREAARKTEAGIQHSKGQNFLSFVAEMKSPFPIFTLETMVLSSSLKSFRSLVIWFVQPLSINHESLELLLVAKHVATKSCSSSCSSAATFASSDLDLHIRSTCPILPNFLHLTSGLHQHFFRFHGQVES